MRLRALSRYLLRRHLAPFGVAFAGLTSLLLIQQIAKHLPVLRATGAPGRVLVEVFVLSMPFIVAMTLPMAVLVAVLYVFTRLPGNGDLTAMSEGGLSVRRLIAPVLGGAACITALSLFWNDQVLPRSNHQLRTLLIEVQRRNPAFPSEASHKGDREMTIAELRRAARSARVDGDRAAIAGHETMEHGARERVAMYEVEIQKKLAIAATCVAFVLLGAAIGLWVRRVGVWLVMVVSIAVFGLYYIGLIAARSSETA